VKGYSEEGTHSKEQVMVGKKET